MVESLEEERIARRDVFKSFEGFEIDGADRSGASWVDTRRGLNQQTCGSGIALREQEASRAGQEERGRAADENPAPGRVNVSGEFKRVESVSHSCRSYFQCAYCMAMFVELGVVIPPSLSWRGTALPDATCGTTTLS